MYFEDLENTVFKNLRRQDFDPLFGFEADFTPSRNGGGLVKSMTFRLTSGQTSSEKNFRKNFYRLKSTDVKFQGGAVGVVLVYETTFWSNSPKNTLLSFKRQKRTQLLKWRNIFVQMETHPKPAKNLWIKILEHMTANLRNKVSVLNQFGVSV